VQVADAAALAVGDLTERRRGERRDVQGRRDLGRVDRERVRRRQLESARGLEVGDPDGAVDRRPADRAVALRDDLTGRAAQLGLAVDAEQVELAPADRVEHARVALGGTDAADHRGGGVGAPVDRAVGLADQRPQPAGDARVVVVERLARADAGGDGADRLHDRVDRGAAHFVAVQAALAGLARGERARGPDVAGVHLAARLEHGHAPLGHAQLDRPVERRRPAVALRAGVHDEAAMVAPDGLGDERLEHRADDQLRPVPGDGGLHLGAGADDRDGDVVAQLGQRHERALAEAVVRADEEEDPQRSRRAEGDGEGGHHP
jgi:hypothetical protein